MESPSVEKTETRDSAVVVRESREHAPAMALFVREVWGQAVTAERLVAASAAAAAANPVEPGVLPPSFVFLKGRRALGHLGTIPIGLWCRGSEEHAHWAKGLMVVPEHRNGPIGFMLLKEAVRELGPAMALVVELPARRLFQAHGFLDLGAIPNHLRLLDAAEVLRRIDPQAIGLGGLNRSHWLAAALQRSPISRVAGAVINGTSRLWTVAGRGSSRLDVEMPGEAEGDELDRLWLRVRPGLAASPVRDGAYLHWRYERRDAERYRRITVREGDELVGFAAVRAPSAGGDPRLQGIRVAVLSELVFPVDRSDIGLSLIAAAEGAARRVEAHALLCTSSHVRLRALLRRRAFLILPGNVHFLARHPEGNQVFPERLGAWWLTRGDSDADEAF